MKTVNPSLIAPLHTVFPQGSLIFFSGPHKLSTWTKHNYIRCAIPQSVTLPCQSLSILEPDPKYSWNICFCQKK